LSIRMEQFWIMRRQLLIWPVDVCVPKIPCVFSSSNRDTTSCSDNNQITRWRYKLIFISIEAPRTPKKSIVWKTKEWMTTWLCHRTEHFNLPEYLLRKICHIYNIFSCYIIHQSNSSMTDRRVQVLFPKELAKTKITHNDGATLRLQHNQQILSRQ